MRGRTSSSLCGASPASLSPKSTSTPISLRRTRARRGLAIAAWEVKLATQPGDLNVAAMLLGRGRPLPVSPSTGEPAAVVEPARLRRCAAAAGGAGWLRRRTSRLARRWWGPVFAPAGAVARFFVRPRQMLVPALAAFAVGAHTTPVSPGEASWSRLGISALPACDGRGAGRGSRRGAASRSVPFASAAARFRSTIRDDLRPGRAARLEVGSAKPGRRLVVRGAGDRVAARAGRLLAGAPGSANLPRAEGLVGLGVSYAGGP